MSRTKKGAKGAGWEPWSNKHDKEELRIKDLEKDTDKLEDETCPGCSQCICVKCGGWIVTTNAEMSKRELDGTEPIFKCINCGHIPKEEEK